MVQDWCAVILWPTPNWHGVGGSRVPLPGPTVKYQRHLSIDVKLGAGPENKAGSIQQSFLENCYAQDGMQLLVLQATHFAECGLLGSLAGQTLEWEQLHEVILENELFLSDRSIFRNRYYLLGKFPGSPPHQSPGERG